MTALGSMRSGSLSGFLGNLYRRTWEGNLLALDWESDFLAPFVSKSESGGYVGLGKSFEALTRMAHETGEARLLERRRFVLDTLIGAREPDGYLGTFASPSRYERLWDVHEVAYLVLALLADYELHADDVPLSVARETGDLLLARLDAATLEQAGKEPWGTVSPHLGLLGLDRAMVALSRITGDERYARFARDRLGLEAWDLGIVEGRFEPIEGHMYAYLERALAQLELRELDGSTDVPPAVDRALAYLLGDRALLVSGTCSIEECWHSDQTVSGDIGETCATAYLIRLLWKLLRRGGAGRYGDLMERAIHNTLAAAQSPDGRRLRYYVPLEGERRYWEKDTYCCPGNFRRVVSELPNMIAAGGGRELLVNLYAESSVSVRIDEDIVVELTQRTDYPNSGLVDLEINADRPVGFTLSLRTPGYAPAPRVTVNGIEPHDGPAPDGGRDGFIAIRREWRRGDHVRLEVEMPWRWIRGIRRQAGRSALARGPMLYCFNPHRNPGIDAGAVCGGEYALDPQSVEGPFADEGPRPGGTACRVTGQRTNTHGRDERVELTLTEFADPDGVATYFPLVDPSSAVDDELWG